MGVGKGAEGAASTINSIGPNMNRMPWSQFVIGLDRLMLDGHIANMQQAEERAETIDAYLEACGWTWDLVLEEICREETVTIQTEPSN